jgi:magnesium transporter
VVIRGFTWLHGESLPDSRTLGTLPETPRDGWVWVDLSDESPETIVETCRHFGISEAFIDEALEPGSLPVIEEQRDLIHVVLNAFTSVADGRLGPSEIDYFVGESFVLSIHDGTVTSTTMVIQRLEQDVGLTVPTPAGLLANLAMVASRRLPPLIEMLETQIDALEELAMRADPRALTEVYALRRDVIVLRRVLLPQWQIYDELGEGGHPLIDDDSRAAFDRVADYQGQILELLETARSLLGSVLETHRGAVADQTNEIVRILTVFSAILLPLTLVTGIYGMNFRDIPLAAEPAGFWILIGGMAVAALVLWLYFSRRGFLGAPRLRELPKAVGLGLYQAGSVPIRAVAGGIGSTIRLVTGSQAGPESEDEA